MLHPLEKKLRGGKRRDAVSQLANALSKIGSLENRIAEIARAVSGKIAFSTSLGLEDQAVLHAIAQAGAGIDIFTLDTGRHFPETLETLERSEQRYGLRIRVVAPDGGRRGAAGRARRRVRLPLSVDARKACCEVRKVRPLERALAGAAAWITGLRRGQSAGRAEMPFARGTTSTASSRSTRWRIGSLERLDAYIAANDIPVNPLHARGFPSIGCQPCTRAIRPGEDIRAGRWWWENEDGKECGLHNRPGALAGASA